MQAHADSHVGDQSMRPHKLDNWSARWPAKHDDAFAGNGRTVSLRLFLGTSRTYCKQKDDLLCLAHART